jgi:hypothetical protein
MLVGMNTDWEYWIDTTTVEQSWFHDGIVWCYIVPTIHGSETIAYGTRDLAVAAMEAFAASAAPEFVRRFGYGRIVGCKSMYIDHC